MVGGNTIKRKRGNYMKNHLFFIPILLIITANILYHLFLKATPSKANPILSLIVTYMVAMLGSRIIYTLSPKEENLFSALKELNWASYLRVRVDARRFQIINEEG